MAPETGRTLGTKAEPFEGPNFHAVLQMRPVRPARGAPRFSFLDRLKTRNVRSRVQGNGHMGGINKTAVGPSFAREFSSACATPTAELEATDNPRHPENAIYAHTP